MVQHRRHFDRRQSKAENKSKLLLVMVGFLGLMTNRRSGGGGISFLALSSTIVVALYNQLRMTIKSSGGGSSSSSGISVYNGIGNLEVPLLIDQMDQPRNLSSSLSFSSFLFPTTKFTVQQPPQQEQLQSKEEEISSSISSETVEYLYARYKNVTTKIRKSVDQEVEDDEEQNTLQLSSLSSSQPSSQHPPQPKPVYRKWAYVFLLGGCNSNDPEYRGFLYNTVVATKILQTHNTKADIVLLIQMSMLTNETSLPHDEEQLLNYYNIKIKYIPKFLSRYSETFYALVMEKFRILSLVEYSRVLFLDGDIMPYCSLDYIFELSEPPSQEDAHNIIQQPPPLLKENVIISWKDEPANAGLFMLKPNLNEYKQIQRIIIKKEKKALQIGHFPWWDPIEGWGHVITPDDAWRSEYNVRGTNWTWHASFADQGLLYYWTKYIKHNVSQIIGNEIDHYTSGIKTIIGKDQSKKQRLVPVLEATTYGTLSNFTCSPTIPSKKNVPHRDFMHFSGRDKPWEQSHTKWLDPNYVPPPLPTPASSNVTTFSSFSTAITTAEEGGKGGKKKGRHHRDNGIKNGIQIDFWFRTLRDIERETNISISLDFMRKHVNQRRPPMGRFSSYLAMIGHIRAKKQNNWTLYASS